MDAKYINEIENNEIVRKRVAKLMALRCIRNTVLEDFHAGTFPSTRSGDYSDVKVVSLLVTLKLVIPYYQILHTTPLRLAFGRVIT